MDYILHLILLCGIYMILAMSLNLINGKCGQFSLGHAGFWAVGAYTGASFTVFTGWPLPGFLMLFLSCIVSFLCAALAGVLIGVPCLRLRGDYLAIATLGFGEIIRIIIINMDVVGGPRGFTDIPKLSNLFWTYFWVGITILTFRNLMHGTHGRAIISIREDEIAAESMGIATFKYKTLAFVIGAGFAGIAGTLFAHAQQFISPQNFIFMWSAYILLMIILGGLGSFTGSIIGATLFLLLGEALRFFGETVAEYRMIIYALLLVLLMLLRPQGLFGKGELKFFWKGSKT
ncbi:MAG: branched-chain amino acid ABC transporter permease [Bacteriovoracales bacterium]|nr:branched-chain amino acid ABC transporter permease [Bacteriovoracales bacterium]